MLSNSFIDKIKSKSEKRKYFANCEINILEDLELEEKDWRMRASIPLPRAC